MAAVMYVQSSTGHSSVTPPPQRVVQHRDLETIGNYPDDDDENDSPFLFSGNTQKNHFHDEK